MVRQLASEYLVERPVLTERMDAALSSPLTLLVAQAGAGKTVLLQQWTARHPDVAFAWLDLEVADDDPARFTRRLLDGLAAVRPEVREVAHLSALSSGGLGGPLLQALSADLERFPETVIVLEDLHQLSDATLLADIGRLAASVPANVHVVISTRVDPPIAWSRLRLRDRLLEIRQADLAMTDAESAVVLAKVARRDVATTALQVLTDRTEGWAAGLHLAGLTLRFHADSDAFVAEFGGTDRLIAEYLTQEVLASLPESTRDLLVRMSPLETMTAALVDEVLERSDARFLFERLEQESLFLVATDARREHFRFHHLFRDLLRYRLRADDPDEEVRLLALAADHHLARGELAPAVEYLLRARDWQRALDAIMTRGSDAFERGEMRTVIRWINTVPEAARAHRLDVSLELGMLLGMQGDIAPAVDLLSRVANEPRATVGERAVAHVWLSAATQWSPHPYDAIRASERALALLEANPDAAFPDLMRLTTPALLTTLTVVSRGRSHFLAGELADAETWLLRALETEGIAYPPFRVGTLGSLALLRICQGRAVEAHLLVAEALDIAGTSDLLAHPVVADAYLAEGMVAYERGLSAAAVAPLREGSVRANANRRTQLAWISRCHQALLAVADGRFGDAHELLDLSGHDAASAPAPVILDRLVAAHMSVLRRTGRSEESLRLRRGTAPTSAELAFETIAALLALGRRDTAQRLLGTTTELFDAEGPRGDIQRAILLAWMAGLEGDRGRALELAGSALDLAEPDGLVEVFIGSDPVVLDLVAELSSSRGGLADAILSRRRQVAPPDANAGLPEPLTERELEILGYLPDHSTNGELAKRCFVSVNTLKTHMAHIYRKLGVSGRSAAIVRARELGLLDPVSRVEQARA